MFASSPRSEVISKRAQLIDDCGARQAASVETHFETSIILPHPFPPIRVLVGFIICRGRPSLDYLKINLA
jgi:hypothetical protein